MNRYEITWRGKVFVHRGEDAAEAMQKFVNRTVFGNPLVVRVRRTMIDADTGGKEWAVYNCDGHHTTVDLI